jgi:hypothetical protein
MTNTDTGGHYTTTEASKVGLYSALGSAKPSRSGEGFRGYLAPNKIAYQLPRVAAACTTCCPRSWNRKIGALPSSLTRRP